jgi:hypothetical protein
MAQDQAWGPGGPKLPADQLGAELAVAVREGGQGPWQLILRRRRRLSRRHHQQSVGHSGSCLLAGTPSSNAC